MQIQTKIVKDELGGCDIIFYHHGKYLHPIMILDDFEFAKLVDEIQAKIKKTEEPDLT